MMAGGCGGGDDEAPVVTNPSATTSFAATVNPNGSATTGANTTTVATAPGTPGYLATVSASLPPNTTITAKNADGSTKALTATPSITFTAPADSTATFSGTNGVPVPTGFLAVDSTVRRGRCSDYRCCLGNIQSPNYHHYACTGQSGWLSGHCLHCYGDNIHASWQFHRYDRRLCQLPRFQPELEGCVIHALGHLPDLPGRLAARFNSPTNNNRRIMRRLLFVSYPQPFKAKFSLNQSGKEQFDTSSESGEKAERPFLRITLLSGSWSTAASSVL